MREFVIILTQDTDSLFGIISCVLLFTGLSFYFIIIKNLKDNISEETQQENE